MEKEGFALTQQQQKKKKKQTVLQLNSEVVFFFLEPHLDTRHLSVSSSNLFVISKGNFESSYMVGFFPPLTH